MQWHTSLLTLAAVWAVVVVTPGPDFLATAHRATSGSRREALAVAGGIAVGTASWAALAMAGLATVLAQATWLATTLRLAGAAYLVYLGVRLLIAKRGVDGTTTRYGTNTFRQLDRRPFALGLLTDLSNPKAAAFWSSVFAVVMPAQASLLLRIEAIIVAVTIAATWYGLVALTFSIPQVTRLYKRAARWVDRIAGCAMIAFGGRLALDDR